MEYYGTFDTATTDHLRNFLKDKVTTIFFAPNTVAQFFVLCGHPLPAKLPTVHHHFTGCDSFARSKIAASRSTLLIHLIAVVLVMCPMSPCTDSDQSTAEDRRQMRLQWK